MTAIHRREIEAAGATVEITVDEHVQGGPDPRGFVVGAGSRKRPWRPSGSTPKRVFITGFTDASIYNNQRIEMAVVGIGAQNEHSTDECIEVADMEKAVAMLLEIFRLVATGS